MKLSNILTKGSMFAAIAVLAASCANEDVIAPAGNGNVTFTATLADVPMTRAFADGYSAKKLTCAVYDETGKAVAQEYVTFADNSLSTSVSLQLLEGKTYDIAFFAAPDNSVYTFNSNTHKVSIDYTAMAAEKEDGYSDDDFFYQIVKGFVAGKDAGQNITLYRPVAQVNVGTSDLASDPAKRDFAAGVTTTITLNAFKTFDLLSGEAADEEVVTFPAMLASKLSGETFPVPAKDAEIDAANPVYEYIAMGYALIPQEGSVSNVTLKMYNGVAVSGSPVVTVDVPNAPMKRNFRTNIYGALITAASDWDITVSPDWDGSTNYPVFNAATDLTKGGSVIVADPQAEITIPDNLATPLELNFLAPAKKLNIGSIAQPVTITVAKDVDYPEISFVRGAEVKGLTIIGDPDSKKALKNFDFLNNKNITRPALLADLTIEGVTFEEYGFVPQYTVSTENTVIRNCKFLNMKDAGIAIQHAQGGGNEYAKNLTVEDCVIEIAADAPSNVNGLYLLDIQGGVVLKNNVVRNATYHGAFISSYDKYSTNVILEGNEFINVRKDGVKLDQIKGEIIMLNNKIQSKENGIRLKNCVDTANVTLTGNTIDMKDAIEWNEKDGEPCAILLVNSSKNAGAKVVVKNNTISNSNTHDFSAVNVEFAAGSEYPQD